MAITFDEYRNRARSKYGASVTDDQIAEGYTAKYGGDAVSTQGPSQEDFATRARAKYPNVTDDQISEAYSAKYGSSTLTDLKRAGKRGFAQGAEFIGKGLGVLGAEDLGASVRDYWKASEAANQMSTQERSKDWWAPSRLAQSVVETGVGMWPTLAFGGLAGAGGRLIGQGVGRIAGTAIGSATGGAQDAAAYKDQLIAQGMPEAEAQRLALMYFPISTALELAPVGRILGQVPGRLKTAGIESITEGLQQTAQNALADQNLTDDVLQSMVVGGLVGGALGTSGTKEEVSAGEAFRRRLEEMRGGSAQRQPEEPLPSAEAMAAAYQESAPREPQRLPAPADWQVTPEGEVIPPGGTPTPTTPEQRAEALYGGARPSIVPAEETAPQGAPEGPAALPAPQTAGFQISPAGVATPFTEAQAQQMAAKRQEAESLGGAGRLRIPTTALPAAPSTTQAPIARSPISAIDTTATVRQPPLRATTPLPEHVQSALEANARSEFMRPGERPIGGDRRNQALRDAYDKLTKEQQFQMSYTNPLSGLANRRAFFANPELGGAVSMDMDGLKAINDKYGHSAGDALLKAFGDAIYSVTKEAYHFSGDEFVIQAPTEAEARQLAARIHDVAAKTTYKFSDPKTGQTVERTGIEFGWASGPNYQDADNKLAPVKAGKRKARAEQANREQAGPYAQAMLAMSDQTDDFQEDVADYASEMQPVAEDVVATPSGVIPGTEPQQFSDDDAESSATSIITKFGSPELWAKAYIAKARADYPGEHEFIAFRTAFADRLLADPGVAELSANKDIEGLTQRLLDLTDEVSAEWGVGPPSDDIMPFGVAETGAQYGSYQAATSRVPTISNLAQTFAATLERFDAMSSPEQRKALATARRNLRERHGISGQLIAQNGKLEKTESETVVTYGLSLSQATEIDGFSTCPNSASCRTLCLGLTSGGNFMFGGGKDLAALKGPRLAHFKMTQAFARSPEDFIMVLHDNIRQRKAATAALGQHLGVRLNVLSDIHPRAYQTLIARHPDVTFYDYTKLASNPIAPNHHLTYSSTGLSQPAIGVTNPHQNWRWMRNRLDRGMNISMGFASKKGKDLPKFLLDAETGKRYRVVDGDTHDFRPADAQPQGADGVVVGLRNKATPIMEKTAAQQTNGFFIQHDPAAGDTYTVAPQGAIQIPGVRETAAVPAKRPRRKTTASTEISKRQRKAKAIVDKQVKTAYDSMETRPGTTESDRQRGRDALWAIRSIFFRDRNGGARLLASKVWQDIVVGHSHQLIGTKVESATDLAVAAQILRNNAFETQRFFLTDDNGVIVDFIDLGSRMPNYVSFGGVSARDAQDGPDAVAAGNSKRVKEIMETIRERMQASGATGYWMLHNHPSGNSKASEADKRMTEYMSKTIPGLRGHVIIDSNEFTEIEMAGQFGGTPSPVERKHKIENSDRPAYLSAPDIFGMRVITPSDAVRTGQALTKKYSLKDGYSIVFTTNAAGNITAVAEYPTDMLSGATPADRVRSTVRMRKFHRHTQGSERQHGPASAYAVFVVTPNPESLKHLVHEGVIMDAISPAGYSPFAYTVPTSQGHYRLSRTSPTTGVSDALDDLLEAEQYRPGYRSTSGAAPTSKHTLQSDLVLTHASGETEVIMKPFFDHVEVHNGGLVVVMTNGQTQEYPNGTLLNWTAPPQKIKALAKTRSELKDDYRDFIDEMERDAGPSGGVVRESGKPYDSTESAAYSMVYEGIEPSSLGITPDPALTKLLKRAALARDAVDDAARGAGWGSASYRKREARLESILGQVSSLLEASAGRSNKYVTQTPEFKRWFGDSKVVDKNGDPLRVYHGTRSGVDFEAFEPGAIPTDETGTPISSASGTDPISYIGSHFAEDPKIANLFASDKLYGGSRYEEGNPRVYPVYLSIKKPLHITEAQLRDLVMQQEPPESMTEMLDDPDQFYRRWDKAKPATRRQMTQDLFDNFADRFDDEGVEAMQTLASNARETLQAKGYDGIIYDNEIEGGTSYIAFRPEQIKSAIGNIGEFDAANPSIVMEQGAPYERESTGPATGSTAPPTATPPPATPRPDRMDVGGGSYSMAEFGGMSDRELDVLTSAMQQFEGNIAQQRGTRTQTWDATEQAALKRISERLGIDMRQLVRRKPGSAASATQLEEYGIVLTAATQEVANLAKRAQQTGSNDDLLALAAAREKLGMLIAPVMGYHTEAGRALNIIRKQKKTLEQASAILANMGDGGDLALKDFAKRIASAESLDQVIGVTRASYTPTMWDKFYEYWINGLLSGPTTHSVNVTSNTLYRALEELSGLIGGAGTRNYDMRRISARQAAIPGAAVLGLKNAGRAFLTEEPQLDDAQKLEARHKAIGGALGRAIRIPGRMLMAEDEFFKSIGYHAELADLAMGEAIRQNRDNPMSAYHQIMGSIQNYPELIKAAREAADKGTFTQPLGPLGRAGMYYLNKSKVGRLIVPFVRTPTNIIKAAIDYTPAGLAKADTRAAFLGNGDPRAVAMARGRITVGSSIMLSALALAAQGMLSGTGPDDPEERALLQRTGWQPYSIKIGDQWVKYNRIDPMGTLIGIAADMYELGGAASALEVDKIASMALTSFMQNLGDKTFLSGVVDFAEALADPGRYAERWALRMAGSVVPNVASQVGRQMDPYSREASTTLDAIRERIPVVRESLSKRIDIGGDPLQTTATIGVPATISPEKTDALAATLLKLGLNKSKPDRKIRGYELSNQEYESYASYVGKVRWNQLTPLVSSPQFRTLMQQNPEVARALLNQHFERVSDAARTAWLFRNPSVIAGVSAARSKGKVSSSRYLQ